ncbi:MAG: hypothetical protein AB1424_14085 [Thermodesulfobacteriota bacterium]
MMIPEQHFTSKQEVENLVLSCAQGGYLRLKDMARGLKIDSGCGLFTDRQVGFGAILEDALLWGWQVASIGGNVKPEAARRDCFSPFNPSDRLLAEQGADCLSQVGLQAPVFLLLQALDEFLEEAQSFARVGVQHHALHLLKLIRGYGQNYRDRLALG